MGTDLSWTDNTASKSMSHAQQHHARNVHIYIYILTPLTSQWPCKRHLEEQHIYNTRHVRLLVCVWFHTHAGHAAILQSPSTVVVMSSSSKDDDRKLGKLGLHNKVSERGISSILTAAADDPSLLERTSRNSYKRSLQRSACVSNTYGDLMRSIVFDSSNSEYDELPGLELPYVDPVVLLTHCVDNFPDFAELIQDAHEVEPSSIDMPWSLMIYSDEVNPGDTHAKLNYRKTQTIYWSINN